jgi:hypothetical protein
MRTHEEIQELCEQAEETRKRANEGVQKYWEGWASAAMPTALQAADDSN